MIIFNIISLLGGLALFLYGMRLMSTTLKQSSSGALKKAMSSVTDNPLKAFALGVGVTAIIQSSTATIVITSGLVAAEVITLTQSLGIIVGANVGTTVTGQIIRLLDLNSSSTAWLQFFKPSTLAPLALIAGIILLMFVTLENSETIGSILMGFGILFTGLMNMTSSVDSLSATGIFDQLFSKLGSNPLIGYAIGAAVAFILQSSSATIGILQAFASTGQLTFKSIYAVLLGIYLGDCVTTGIVCSIGAKPNAKRVGVVNILFNLSETVVVFVVVTVAHQLGLLDGIWDRVFTSGDIANTNTIFNLGCAVVLFPCLRLYEKASYVIVKEVQTSTGIEGKIEELNPAFFETPALALNSTYDVLSEMFYQSRKNVEDALNLIGTFDKTVLQRVYDDEASVDALTDAVGNYLVQMSPYIHTQMHTAILDQYYKNNTDFERLSDYALNIAQVAESLNKDGLSFSSYALEELDIARQLLTEILDNAEKAFMYRDVTAAKHIEPLEQVTDDLVQALGDKHLERLREGVCTIDTGTLYMNLLTYIERLSDVCSNIGVATLARVYPELKGQAHGYVSTLKTDEQFQTEYQQAHEVYFTKMAQIPELEAAEKKDENAGTTPVV